MWQRIRRWCVTIFMPDTLLPIVVIGAGGHARVLAEALVLGERRIAGHVAPEAALRGALGSYLGGDDAVAGLLAQGMMFALGVGFVNAAGAARRAAMLDLVPEAAWASVAHPRSIVSPSAQVGAGAFIAAGAVLGCDAVLGRGVIVNTGAVVDHDCQIGVNSHIATGARLAGSVTVGAHVLIGAGAVVRQGIAIGDGAIVGAGAVVIRDVAAGAVVVGNPARAI